jgi:cell division protein ZapA (FtsZ GTPase activity inhibitor)
MSAGDRILIDIAGQQFRIAPPEGDVERLTRAVTLVTERVERIQRAGVVASNRSALLAALDLALELLAQRESPTEISEADLHEARSRVESMIDRLNEALPRSND